MRIKIPNMPDWEQIGGDMSPGQYGGIIARSDGDALELREIQPVREYVGDSDAAEVGFPFWSREAYYHVDELDLDDDDVRSALRSTGLLSTNLLEELSPTQRALAIAESLLAYGYADEGPAGWADDVVPDKVKWWGGVGGPEYLYDEDDDFRTEILGEDV